ncbi:MAG: oxygenase MpaB family protein [Nitrospira sp.]|nr:oxygenase MpaB family protein [Nitrospira sp.]
MSPPPPPSAYADGYAKARLFDEAVADNYIRHIIIGDPVLDPVLEEVSGLSPDALHRFIEAGIEQQVDVLRSAPQALRDFFDHFEEPPWLDYQAFRPGILVFNENVQLMLVAFVAGVLVEGFSTLIAKSFNITKRVESSDRRLKQNNRQLMEIFYPGGLRRDGDGWKLSTRVRFVHARIRNLLAKSDDWKHDAWGAPLSAAHLGFALSIFSKRLLDYSALVGARFSDEEKESVLAVWRYAGYLMGIPETILYTNAKEADTIYRIGYMCEPLPDADSVTMANALIQSIPSVAGITDPGEKKKVISLAYRLSRALLGNTLANQFQYPKGWNIGTLFLFRNKQRMQRWFKRWFKKGGIRSDNFSQMLQISVYDEGGLSYKMPNHVYNSKSNPW